MTATAGGLPHILAQVHAGLKASSACFAETLPAAAGSALAVMLPQDNDDARPSERPDPPAALRLPSFLLGIRRHSLPGPFSNLSRHRADRQPVDLAFRLLFRGLAPLHRLTTLSGGFSAKIQFALSVLVHEACPLLSLSDGSNQTMELMAWASEIGG